MGLFHKSWLAAAVVAVAVAIGTGSAIAESGGSSGTINGTVLDPSGAVVANANVEIRQAVSGYDRTATTDSKGSFTFVNVPFNPYHMTVTAAGFASSVQDVDVRSIVPVSVSVSLTVAGNSDTVTVEDTGDLVENDPTFSRRHRQAVDRPTADGKRVVDHEFGIVGEATPGIAADSNGLFHGLGDHAENSFNIDDQPDTDQHSKMFSNQISVDSIQSHGSHLGRAAGGIWRQDQRGDCSDHAFGPGCNYAAWQRDHFLRVVWIIDVSADVAYGGKNWGNFISVGGLNTRPVPGCSGIRGDARQGQRRESVRPRGLPTLIRRLDPPELRLQPELVPDAEFIRRPERDALERTGRGCCRQWRTTGAWFRTAIPSERPTSAPRLGPLTSRLRGRDVVNTNAVFTLGAFVRRDDYNYYPSSDPFADLGPPSLQRQSVGQNRTLTNAGSGPIFPM